MRLTINIKIAIIFTLILGLVFAGVYVYLDRNLKEHTYQRIRSNLLREAAFAATFLEKEQFSLANIAQADMLADRIGQSLGLRATIISRQGVVLGDSEQTISEVKKIENHLYRPEVQEALHQGEGVSRRFSDTVKQDMLYVALSVNISGKKCIVRLSVPLEEVTLISQRLKRLLVVSFFIAFCCAIIVNFGASIWVSRPVKEAAWAAKNIAHGDYSRRIMVRDNDEIGDLARSVNYMSEQIEARIDEVVSNKTRLEAVLLSMFDGVMVVNTNGTILLMNQTLKDFLFLEGDPVGKKPLEVIRNIEIQKLAEEVLVITHGVISKEIAMMLPEKKILLVHATPVTCDNSAHGAVLVFHDITALRALEQVRRDFVANVSHELRTPTTSIKGYLETLLSGALSDEDASREFLTIMYEESNRLAQLIDDLLDLSKIESDVFQLHRAPCSLQKIIERVVAGMEKKTQAKNLTLTLDLPEKLTDIKIDEQRVEQVMMNLVDNALKYTPAGGAVTVTVTPRADMVEVSVHDTGCGIPEGSLPRIFERFYRVDKARSRQLGGTGLGLSIVKHLVQAHGGSVTVQSVVDGGSTFTITLPY